MATTAMLALFTERIVTLFFSGFLGFCSSCIMLHILAIDPISNTKELLLGPHKNT